MTTRAKILNTALELFNEKGYNDVGVRELARSMDISPGNLSYYFPKKEDLFFALMKSYSQQNDQYFNQFIHSEPTLKNYLIMMREMLRNQYRHRGLFLAFSLFYEEAQADDMNKYRQRYARREKNVRQILDGLVQSGHLQINKEDARFLLSFLTLFGRFSIIEAFILDKDRSEKDILYHYLSMLSRQMLFFATKNGAGSIQEFKDEFLA